jgi:hypothetical protein
LKVPSGGGGEASADFIWVNKLERKKKKEENMKEKGVKTKLKKRKV